MEEIFVIIFVFGLFSLFGVVLYLCKTHGIRKEMNKYYKSSHDRFISDVTSKELQRESQKKTLFAMEKDLDLVYSIENHVPYKTVKEWHRVCDLMDAAYIKKGKAAESEEYEIFKSIDDKAGWLKYSEWRYSLM